MPGSVMRRLFPQTSVQPLLQLEPLAFQSDDASIMILLRVTARDADCSDDLTIENDWVATADRDKSRTMRQLGDLPILEDLVPFLRGQTERRGGPSLVDGNLSSQKSRFVGTLESLQVAGCVSNGDRNLNADIAAGRACGIDQGQCGVAGNGRDGDRLAGLGDCRCVHSASDCVASCREANSVLVR